MRDQHFLVDDNMMRAGVDYVVAPATVTASFLGFLPELAALAGLAWYGIRIWETCTVQGWFGRKCKEKG